MNNDSKSKKGFLLLILVLTISIGYAAIASTLKINGNTTVKGLNWSIYWDNVVPTTGSVTGANVVTAPTTTGTTTTTIDFSVILPEPGDFYEFEVDAVNAGTIDAMIADNGVITKAYSDANYTNEVTLPDVVRYTVTYQDGTAVEPNHLLAKMSGNTPTRERYKVRVEYRNDDEINPDDLDGANDRQYYLRFEVEYVQANDNVIDLHPAQVNPYQTTFDGSYAYSWSDVTAEGYTGIYDENSSLVWFNSLNTNSQVYLRNNGTTVEVCTVFGSGQSGTVCIKGLGNGDWNTDFPEDYDTEDPYDPNNTKIEGYTKAKLDEMLSKGANQCEVNYDSGYAGCSNTDGTSCHISEYGSIECFPAQNGQHYCSVNSMYYSCY